MWMRALQEMWIRVEVLLGTYQDIRWSSIFAKPYADVSSTLKHGSGVHGSECSSTDYSISLAFELQDQQYYMCLQLVYVPTMKQIADGLTKPLSSALHQTLCVNNLLVQYDIYMFCAQLL